MITRIYQYGRRLRCVGYKNPFGNPDDVGSKSSSTQVFDYDSLLRSSSNISRARARIRELAFCNQWDYFVTVTVDSSNQNRSDLSLLKKRWNQCLKDYSLKYGARPRYLIIPELHADGQNWHLHGLMSNLAPLSLKRNEHGYLDIPYLRKRFGFVSLSQVRDADKCASYVTKYVTKEISSCQENGKHLFFSSQGLNGKVLIYQGDFILPWSFENDYVKIYEGYDLETIMKGEQT